MTNPSTAPVPDSAPKTSKRPALTLTLLILVFVLITLVVVSAGMGYIAIPFGEVARFILAGVLKQPEWIRDLDPVWATVVNDVRLPRILTAALVGAGLAVAGAVFQGILLNPLADPYTLGVSAGAAFGASLAILFNLEALGTFSLPLFAFLGAVGTLILVIYLSAGSGGWSSHSLILSGIIVSAILAAGISFLKYLADEQVALIIFWLMGSFAAKTWHDVQLILVILVLGSAVCLFYARDLNLMALGERTAASLGVDTRRVAMILLVTASLVTATCVALSGIIGFVGLLVPHMMRMTAGPDNRSLIPLCMLAGAILLLGADTFTRALLPGEVPIGVLTALIGGPFFCWIFRRRQVSGKG